MHNVLEVQYCLRFHLPQRPYCHFFQPADAACQCVDRAHNSYLLSQRLSTTHAAHKKVHPSLLPPSARLMLIPELHNNCSAKGYLTTCVLLRMGLLLVLRSYGCAGREGEEVHEVGIEWARCSRRRQVCGSRLEWVFPLSLKLIRVVEAESLGMRSDERGATRYLLFTRPDQLLHLHCLESNPK